MGLLSAAKIKIFITIKIPSNNIFIIPAIITNFATMIYEKVGVYH
ncbi:MAG: hypothetical protein KatS3mg035_0868 [Bacteroidia bacterium]|nr:MAG: hypothetical protein KatS3mg035_0868 [Bacteroidia bacterium]